MENVKSNFLLFQQRKFTVQTIFAVQKICNICHIHFELFINKVCDSASLYNAESLTITQKKRRKKKNTPANDNATGKNQARVRFISQSLNTLGLQKCDLILCW